MSFLEVDDVVVRFGGILAVNHATYSAEAGQITGLIGPNGAGKTTNFNVITGLQRPNTGQVRFNGRDISALPVPRRARLGIGRTFQRLEAFGSLTVRDNVRVAADIAGGMRGVFRSSRADIDELLERVGIAHLAHERADSIPTGSARLMELARALANKPKMLLLDEPSSGLDETETDAFGELLMSLAADGCAILMVEHDMDLVMAVCDWINVLDFGAIIATGTPEEIRVNPVVKKAYLGYSDDETTDEADGVHVADDLHEQLEATA